MEPITARPPLSGLSVASGKGIPAKPATYRHRSLGRILARVRNRPWYISGVRSLPADMLWHQALGLVDARSQPMDSLRHRPDPSVYTREP
jgi:hypothetical protein